MKKGSFCAGSRRAVHNSNPRWPGQFNSVIVLGQRNGVRCMQSTTNFATTYKKFNMYYEQIHDGNCPIMQLGRFGHFKSDNFIWSGAANMLCSGGETLRLDGSFTPDSTEARFRVKQASGAESVSSGDCGFMTIYNVEGEVFMKDEAE